MTFDALCALRKAGHPVDLLTDRQREVLAGLTEAETTMLNAIKERLDAAGEAEVEGHGTIKIV